MRRNRCVIFIDGSNFYFKLKDLGLQNLLSFDFSSFGNMLAKTYNIVSMTYYVGKIRTDGTKKAQRLYINQQKLLAHLNRHNCRYSLGYLMKSKGFYHEKGVDVQIAVDLLVSAYENKCNKTIVVSSDTDLLPAITKAKEKGKLVEYIGFSHMASKAMIRHCSKYSLLAVEDIAIYT